MYLYSHDNIYSSKEIKALSSEIEHLVPHVAHKKCASTDTVCIYERYHDTNSNSMYAI